MISQNNRLEQEQSGKDSIQVKQEKNQIGDLAESSLQEDSDSSFSLADEAPSGRRLLAKQPKISTNLGYSSLLKNKHGLKYARISNEQRRALINQVTSTGCTIKSAAHKLNINFSTAKAIMQIFKKEGRTQKKICRRDRKMQSYKLFKNLQNVQDIRQQESALQDFNSLMQQSKESLQQQIQKNILKNNQQHEVVQQLQKITQSQQDQINQLSQNINILSNQLQIVMDEKNLISQNYQQLHVQYMQLNQMACYFQQPIPRPFQM